MYIKNYTTEKEKKERLKKLDFTDNLKYQTINFKTVKEQSKHYF